MRTKPTCYDCGCYCRSCGLCRRSAIGRNDKFELIFHEEGDLACVHYFPRADKVKFRGQNLCGEIKRAGNRKDGLLRMKAIIEADLAEINELLESEVSDD